MTALVATAAAVVLTTVDAREQDSRTVIVGGGFALILAVCDVYDALVSPRVYRPAWPHEDALSLLRDESDVAFDSRCIAALERAVTVGRSSLVSTPSRS